MKKQVFKGVCTALVTPFSEGKIDLAMLRRLLTRQMEAGVTAAVICGTTGEAPTLSDAEKITLFREAKAAVGSRAVILAGTGSNSTAHAVALSQAAQDQGADGLLVVSPYYNKASADGLVAHYSAISEAVSLPIVLYNVPSRTGVDIPVSVYRQLAEITNITGVKEASPDLRKIAAIRVSCPPDFAVYSGNDDLLLPILSLGGQGVISVASNVCPASVKAVADAWEKGDPKKAETLFLSLLPLINSLFSEVNPIPVKASMGLLGFDCGECRLPLTKLSAEKYRILQNALISFFPDLL